MNYRLPMAPHGILLTMLAVAMNTFGGGRFGVPLLKCIARHAGNSWLNMLKCSTVREERHCFARSCRAKIRTDRALDFQDQWIFAYHV